MKARGGSCSLLSFCLSYGYVSQYDRNYYLLPIQGIILLPLIWLIMVLKGHGIMSSLCMGSQVPYVSVTEQGWVFSWHNSSSQYPAWCSVSLMACRSRWSHPGGTPFKSHPNIGAVENVWGISQVQKVCAPTHLFRGNAHQFRVFQGIAFYLLQ